MTHISRTERPTKPNPENRGRELIDDWQRSGLSQVAYARQHQIRPHMMSYWKRRLRQLAARSCPPASSLGTEFVQVAVQVPAPSPSLGTNNGPPLEILLSCGAVIRVIAGVDPALLRLVVTMLGDRC